MKILVRDDGESFARIWHVIIVEMKLVDYSFECRKKCQAVERNERDVQGSLEIIFRRVQTNRLPFTFEIERVLHFQIKRKKKNK